jgi:hypothetical protein
VNGEFVARMEDVLDLYAQPYQPQCPLVRFDESPKPLHADARPPIPAAPGRAARVDSEYRRCGTAELLLCCEPLRGWRHIAVCEKRTKREFAHAMRYLAEEQYPQARRIRVVLDNLSTHSIGALYETFPPEQARALAQRLEFHFTPKHGSWLNMAKIEFAALNKACLDRRIGDLQALAQEVAAYERTRNAAGTRIQWRFTTPQARTKMARLYPKHSSG